MKRYHRSLIALLTLFLVLDLVVARSSASAELVRLGPGNTEGLLDRRPEVDWVDRMPVIRALDPEEARRRMQFPADSDRPIVHEREAVLPDPSNGRELVNRYVVTGSARSMSQGWPTGQSGDLKHNLKYATHRNR
jgi:hypothetical protein